MALPLLVSLRGLLLARADVAAGRAATVLGVALLAAVAAGLVVSAGLVALSHEIGFPIAAIVFSMFFALLALIVHALGRMRLARRSAQLTIARNHIASDLSVAASLVGSARPLLPLVAFLAAFVFTRRR